MRFGFVAGRRLPVAGCVAPMGERDAFIAGAPSAVANLTLLLASSAARQAIRRRRVLEIRPSEYCCALERNSASVSLPKKWLREKL